MNTVEGDFLDRSSLFEYVLDTYGTIPEYLWADAPDAAVLRNKSGKWYGITMNVSKRKLGIDEDGITDVLNVKCDPLLVGSLRMKHGYFPAYHMNKTKWISILLDGTVPADEITMLVAMSYDLTKEKTRKRKA